MVDGKEVEAVAVRGPAHCLVKLAELGEATDRIPFLGSAIRGRNQLLPANRPRVGGNER